MKENSFFRRRKNTIFDCFPSNQIPYKRTEIDPYVRIYIRVTIRYISSIGETRAGLQLHNGNIGKGRSIPYSPRFNKYITREAVKKSS